MFIAPLFTIAKRWKQIKCPSTNEQINIHATASYITLKRVEILTTSLTCMKPEDILLSEISSHTHTHTHTHTPNTTAFHLYEVLIYSTQINRDRE